MYYELYIDQIFLENLLLNFLLLLMVRMGGKFSASFGRMILGAAVGSLTGCLFVVFHVTDGILTFFGQLGIGILMVK